MQSALTREYRKMYRNLNGMRTMNRLPECLVVIDPQKEKNAVKRSPKLGITTVALIDTDCDPDVVDLPIPGNDDSIRSIELIVQQLADAVLEGKATGGDRRAGQGVVRRGRVSGGRRRRRVDHEAARHGRCRCGSRRQGAVRSLWHATRAGSARSDCWPLDRITSRHRAANDSNIPKATCEEIDTMAEITAAAVKALRERTGLPMMDCKKALQETGGDENAAVDWLRKQGTR